MNLLLGMPRKWNQNSDSDDVALFYSQQIGNLRKPFRKEVRALGPLLDGKPYADAVEYFDKIDLGGFQFLLCELSKVLNNAWRPSATYKRSRSVAFLVDSGDEGGQTDP